MFTTYLTVTVITIAANAGAAVADFSRARFVVANQAEVGVPESWLPPLGAAKAAGAVGLLIGVVALRPLGMAAATGLVLFFTGALLAHARARVFHNIAFPGLYFALATASLVLASSR